jgi:hypothetical protein
MFKFLIGVVVGIFIGVLVIAPNPEFSARVNDLWADARAWGQTLLGTAENVAGEAAEKAGEAAEQVGDAARDAGEEAGDAVRDATN